MTKNGAGVAVFHQHFHCNAMRKAIKVHKNLHTNQQNEHTPAQNPFDF